MMKEMITRAAPRCWAAAASSSPCFPSSSTSSSALTAAPFSTLPSFSAGSAGARLKKASPSTFSTATAAAVAASEDGAGMAGGGRPEPAQATSMLEIGTRRIFNEEHDAFRETLRQFFAAEVVPFHDQWEQDGHVSREVWLKAGEMGLLGINCPEEYGGLGADVLFAAVSWEEQMYAKGSPSGPGFSLHSDIVMPYLVHLGTEEQKQRYLPPMCRGEKILAIAMTEPGAGSDLAGVRTTAVKNDDGTGWTLNGAKTYITNGYMSDVVVVVAKTGPEKGAHGMSLFLVESSTPGFSKGTPLKKMGLKAQDTCELFFDDVQLPADALLGEENTGFYSLMTELPQERLMIGVEAQARAEAAFEEARQWCNERMAFGKVLLDKQTVRHKLADMKTSLAVNRAFVDSCLVLHSQGRLDPASASMVKQCSTDLAWKVCDDAVQLHGGAGFMWEYPVARQLADSRVPRIYGGANEIMKELIARTL